MLLSKLFSVSCCSSCKTFLADLKQRIQYDCVRTEVNFLTVRVQVNLCHSNVTVSSLRLDTQHTLQCTRGTHTLLRVNLHHSNVTVSSLRLDTQHTHCSAHVACVQKARMLKRRSYKCVAGKNILYCNKRDGENAGHII